MRSVTLSGYKSRRLDLHQHDPVYRTGASLFGHVGFLVPMPRATIQHQKARVRGVEPRTAGLEAACSPRSTLV